MEHTVYTNFLKQLAAQFPKAAKSIEEQTKVVPELISPFVFDIPKSVVDSAKSFIQETFKVYQSQNYQDEIIRDFPIPGAPHNYSALTCFDFHWNEEQGLKLIEVNTNAALALPLLILRNVHDLETPFGGEELLFKEFANTYTSLFGEPLQKVFIFDREPKEEGLYFEFLLYKEWFEQRGLEAKIVNLREINGADISGGLVYNRLTDFYFADSSSIKMRDAYCEKIACFSPNPWGYYLMADKRRLKLLRKHLPESQKQIVPETKQFMEYESFEEVWQKRKKLFFKPSDSHGGKAAFSGKGISRTMFDKIATPEYIAQELAPASKIKLSHEGTEVEMKYDFRFFANPEGIVDGLARLYQGQLTNVKTPLGGIAPLNII